MCACVVVKVAMNPLSASLCMYIVCQYMYAKNQFLNYLCICT